MLTGSLHTVRLNRLRMIFSIVLLEYLMFIVSGVSFSFLYGNTFFSLEADPATWLIYLANIPQWITANQWAGILLDTLIIALLLLFIRNPFNNRLALLLFLLLLLFYVTLMGHLVHHNFQFGFCLVFIPFIFRKETNRQFAFEAARYFLLFFYVSAAWWKIYYNSLSDISHFSHLASSQFTPYYLEVNTGIRTAFNLFLVSHPWFGWSLFVTSVVLELLVIVGFFTKRFDKWIAIFILLFHFSNWFMMDIAPLGQIAFVCLLFISKNLAPGKKQVSWPSPVAEGL